MGQQRYATRERGNGQTEAEAVHRGITSVQQEPQQQYGQWMDRGTEESTVTTTTTCNAGIIGSITRKSYSKRKKGGIEKRQPKQKAVPLFLRINC
jgi:hypothetical protein